MTNRQLTFIESFPWTPFCTSLVLSQKNFYSHVPLSNCISLTTTPRKIQMRSYPSQKLNTKCTWAKPVLLLNTHRLRLDTCLSAWCYSNITSKTVWLVWKGNWFCSFRGWKAQYQGEASGEALSATSWQSREHHNVRLEKCNLTFVFPFLKGSSNETPALRV